MLFPEGYLRQNRCSEIQAAGPGCFALVTMVTGGHSWDLGLGGCSS